MQARHKILQKNSSFFEYIFRKKKISKNWILDTFYDRKKNWRKVGNLSYKVQKDHYAVHTTAIQLLFGMNFIYTPSVKISNLLWWIKNSNLTRVVLIDFHHFDEQCSGGHNLELPRAPQTSAAEKQNILQAIFIYASSSSSGSSPTESLSLNMHWELYF